MKPSTRIVAGRHAKRDGPRNVTQECNKSRTIPALVASDIHFDPFHDPAKAQQLADAPVSQWSAILEAAPSSNQQQAVESLQQHCHARGVDTAYALLRSSLQAMRARQSDTKFMTVSGDLIAHAFNCRFKTLLPQSSEID